MSPAGALSIAGAGTSSLRCILRMLQHTRSCMPLACLHTSLRARADSVSHCHAHSRRAMVLTSRPLQDAHHKALRTRRSHHHDDPRCRRVTTDEARGHAGKLAEGLDCWDALRAALPVGTISGAPKLRAMQIIDELEINQRGPYGGGFGHVSFTGRMDMALALRTMVVPTRSDTTLFNYGGPRPRREWTVHVQAGAGIVADSVPESEYQETVSKSNALSRAIDLAEESFGGLY